MPRSSYSRNVQIGPTDCAVYSAPLSGRLAIFGNGDEGLIFGLGPSSTTARNYHQQTQFRVPKFCCYMVEGVDKILTQKLCASSSRGRSEESPNFWGQQRILKDLIKFLRRFLEICLQRQTGPSGSTDC